MSISINVVKSLNDDKVIVSEKRISKNKVQERKFLLHEKDADGFILQRKGREKSKGILGALAVAASSIIGFEASKSLQKTKNVGLFSKITLPVVFASGIFSLFALMYKSSEDVVDNNIIKSFNAVEIADKKEPKTEKPDEMPENAEKTEK